MTRVEPHSGVCDRCGGLVIDARLPAGSVRLDAAPLPDGEFRAYCGFDGTWRANRVNPPYEDSFLGMRRREHVCVIPDKQLELA